MTATLATVADLKPLTGAGSYDDTTLQAILDQAERQVVARLAMYGKTLPGSSDTLKGAVLGLAHAAVLNRMRTDGSLPDEKIRGIELIIEEIQDEAVVGINAYLQLTYGESTTTPADGMVRTNYTYNVLHYSKSHYIRKINA